MKVWVTTTVVFTLFGLLIFTIFRKFDRWEWGDASLPIQPRGVASSDAELLSLSVEDVNLKGETWLEYCSSSEFHVLGKVLLEHTDYQWSPTKRQLETRSGRREHDEMAKLPRISMAVRLERRSGNERGFDEVVAGYCDLLSHRGRECDWDCHLTLPARTGRYRMAIDLVEYDDFTTMHQPRRQHQLFEAVFNIIRCADSSSIE